MDSRANTALNVAFQSRRMQLLYNFSKRGCEVLNYVSNVRSSKRTSKVKFINNLKIPYYSVQTELTIAKTVLS